ncbi:TPA: glycosyltransferase family 2 protein [Candidatus Ventrenecus avicola]|nr:glycosyltransferase family 2 protein [Candidatus Ventrenecus avicola]
MKYITFAVPCYNSESYMEHCIESLLVGGKDVEIILVDDGSRDNTAKIADKYEKKYPDIVRAVHKENGGHGSGVNKGLELATGLYYKVVDSDDWVDEASLKKVLEAIKKLKKDNTLVDMMVVNYVYERHHEQKEIKYVNTLPENKVFGWDEVGKFKKDAYLLMHSVIYNTKFLKETGLKLPEKTFYVDNIFVYYPLPYIKTMYYLNTPFYRYFIGREDQSVNEKTMIKRIEQQLYVNKLMIDFYDPYEYWDTNRNCAKYLIHYIDIMMSVSTILLQISNTKEHQQKRKELWQYLKEKNPMLYKTCKLSLSGATCLPRFLSIPGYKIAQKIYKFN